MIGLRDYEIGDYVWWIVPGEQLVAEIISHKSINTGFGWTRYRILCMRNGAKYNVDAFTIKGRVSPLEMLAMQATDDAPPNIAKRSN